MTAVVMEAGTLPAPPAPAAPAAPAQGPRPWRGWASVGLLAVYVALAVLVLRHLWADPAHQVSVDNAGDTEFDAWMFAWAPHALAHLQDPWITHSLSVPQGINLGWNTAVVPLGLLFAPVTLIWSPLVSVTLALTLALATSAWSLAMVLGRLPVGRRIGRWPAALGGWVFGFSPALMTQSTGHLNFTALGLIPVILWLVLRLGVGDVDPRRGGLALGVLGGLQVMINEEILLSTVIFGAWIAFILVRRHPEVLREHWRERLRGVLIAGGVAFALGIWLVATQFAGPEVPKGRLYDPDYFSTDLAGWVAATPQQLLHPASAAATNARLMFNASEPTGFVGWGLIALLGAALLLLRDRVLRLCLLAATATAVLSLGHTLRLDATLPNITLPWDLVEHLPLLENMLPSRWQLLTALSLGAAVAIIAQAALSARRPWLRAAASAVVVAALVPLFPSSHPSYAVHVPHWFAQGGRDVPSGSTALVLPFPSPVQVEPMLWQATTGLRFAMPGGYFIAPGPKGEPSLGGVQRPSGQFFASVEGGKATAVLDPIRAQVADDLRAWGATSVVVGPSGDQPNELAVVSELLHRQPDVVDGDVSIWLHVDADAVWPG